METKIQKFIFFLRMTSFIILNDKEPGWASVRETVEGMPVATGGWTPDSPVSPKLAIR